MGNMANNHDTFNYTQCGIMHVCLHNHSNIHSWRQTSLLTILYKRCGSCNIKPRN